MATHTTKAAADRWAAALGRAIAEGLDALEVVGVAGAFAVESGTRPGACYLVTENGRTCTCPAGTRGVPCKHRAAVLAALGTPPQAPATGGNDYHLSAPEPVVDRFAYQVGQSARVQAMRATAAAGRERAVQRRGRISA